MAEKSAEDKKNDGKREKKEKESAEEKNGEKKDDKKNLKKPGDGKLKDEKKKEEDKKSKEIKEEGKTDKSEKKDDPKKDGKGSVTSRSGKTEDERNAARSWFSPHIFIGLLLLIPVLAMAGRSRMPIIYGPAVDRPAIPTGSGLGDIFALPVMAASKGLKRATTSPRATLVRFSLDSQRTTRTKGTDLYQ